MSVEAERRQSICKKPRQRGSEIDANHQDPSRAMNPLRQIHRTTRLQTRSQYAQAFDISFETVLHLVGDTAFFLSCRFQNCVRRDVIDEVLPQVSRKIRETFIP